MTDTDVTFLSCYNIVRHTRMHVMTLYLPSIPATLQALGRVEYATTYAAAPPDSRTATPLILTLFSQRLLDVQKFDSERFHQSSHHHQDLARTHKS